MNTTNHSALHSNNLPTPTGGSRHRWLWPTSVALLLILLLAGVFVYRHLQDSRSPAQPMEQLGSPATMERIQQVNAGRPSAQVQAKMLLFAALGQGKIPDAANWCESLNAKARLWDATPATTVFALNSAVAGHVPSTLPGDAVVLFETSNEGWNQAGGPELLASKPGGVTVALADGRAMVVPSDDALNLRWKP